MAVCVRAVFHQLCNENLYRRLRGNLGMYISMLCCSSEAIQQSVELQCAGNYHLILHATKIRTDQPIFFRELARSADDK